MSCTTIWRGKWSGIAGLFLLRFLGLVATFSSQANDQRKAAQALAKTAEADAQKLLSLAKTQSESLILDARADAEKTAQGIVKTFLGDRWTDEPAPVWSPLSQGSQVVHADAASKMRELGESVVGIAPRGGESIGVCEKPSEIGRVTGEQIPLAKHREFGTSSLRNVSDSSHVPSCKAGQNQRSRTEC
jgi:hypothetical protein